MNETAALSRDDAPARMAFVLRLRARGVAATNVLRALETSPRELFAPHRYADLAWRDVALPIACGQTMPEPSLLARALEALALDKSCRVLEIGTGSGYATAMLAQLAGEVVSIERFHSLAHEAAARLKALGVGNARVLRGDGLAPPPDLGLFDRIIAHGEPPRGPQPWMAHLSQGGSIMFARAEENGRALVSLADGPNGWRESRLFACRLTSLCEGEALCL